MRYFILENDKRYTYPTPKGWFGTLDANTLGKKRSYELPRYLIYDVEENMQMMFTDMILFPCFMVTECVKEVILLYDPHIRSCRVVLFDRKKKRSVAYHILFLPTADCIFEKRGQLIRLDRDKIGDRVITKAFYKGQIYILIRMDLAESILRRKAIGIGLRRTEIVYEGYF